MQVDAENTGDNRPPVYWEGDNLIIRASALGSSCLWELTAAGQGYTPGTLPPVLIKAFAEGHANESYVLERCTNEYGITFLSHQEEADWEIAPGIILRHHPDGIANLGYDFWDYTQRNLNLRYDWGHGPSNLPPRTVVVEVKWLSDALWQKFVKWGMSHVIDEYPWQGSIMMCHHAMPLLWVGGNKEDPDHPLHFELHRNPIISPVELAKKAIAIREAVTGEDIVESGKPCDQPSHWPCRYQHLRPEPEAVQPGDKQGDKSVLFIQADGMESVDRMVRQYLYSKGQADEASDTADRQRDSILEVGEGYDRILTDTWEIPIYQGAKWQLDTDAMKEDGIDVDKYRRKVPGSRYINRRYIKRRVVDEHADKDRDHPTS